jgi:hypothetical protein
MRERPMSVADDLRRITELHAAGMLTEEEFAAAKAQVLRGDVSATAETVPEPAGTSDRPVGAMSGWPAGEAGSDNRGAGRGVPRKRVIALAAGGVLLIAAATGVTVGLTGGAESTGSQARPATEPTYADPDVPTAAADEFDAGTDEYGDGWTEVTGEVEPMYEGDLTIIESGYTPMVDGAIASWGVVVENPTPHFPSAEVTVEVLDKDGAIEDSYSVDVTLQPNSKTPVGGFVPLDTYSTKELAFSVDFDSYSEEDGEFFYPATSEVTGDILGQVFNAEIAVTVESSESVGKFCPIYLVFRDSGGGIVGGAVIEDHPNVPAGMPKTFKKHFIDDLFIPKSAASFTGYPDHAACW